jgi:DNA-binding transcriptional MerR regulator
MLKSITEVANELGVSKTQLRNWSDAKLIECVRKNSVRYFDESEFEKIKIIKKVLAQPKATLDDARKALLGDEALQVIEDEKQLIVTEEMMSAALEKALSGNFIELFEGMAKAFREMQKKIDELQIENAEMKQQLAKIDLIRSHEENMSDELTKIKAQLAQIGSHEEQMKDQVSDLSSREEQKSALIEKILHENEALKKQLEDYTDRINERDQQLMQALRELREAKEEAAAAQQQKRKKKFLGLF